MIDLTDFTRKSDTSREDALYRYLLSVEPDLLYDYNARVNGDGVYVGYKTLREFYKGKQWSFKPDENGNMRTYNYCFVVVENMTAFLAAEPPEMSHEPIDVTDPVERVASEQITKFLSMVHDRNKLPMTFQKGARIGSMLGDTFIVGPFWDAKNKNITYDIAERPELIRPIWESDNFHNIVGYEIQYQMDLKTAEQRFAKQMKARGIQRLLPDTVPYQFAGAIPERQTYQKMVTIKIYVDDTESLWVANEKILDYQKHNSGFISLIHIPNIHLIGEPKGTSDLENVLDPQQEYNISNSEVKDILDAVAFPLLWGNEIDSMSEINTGRGTIYNMPEKSTLNAIQVSGNPTVVENYSSTRRNDIIAMARLNDVVVQGGGNISHVSGRAMSVLMQGINNSVGLKKPFWEAAFELLNENILKLAEQHVPGAKEIIRGNYNTSVFISSAYMRSITDELNKLTHKTQSLTTTMKNIGIPSPDDEIKLMKEELADITLNVELSRQPGMAMQLEAQQQQQAQQQEQAQTAQNENAVISQPGAISPTLQEGQNQPGESPASVPGQGNPMSPAGAVARGSQMATNAPMMPSGNFPNTGGMNPADMMSTQR